MYHSSLSVVSRPHSSCVRERMAASRRRATALPCPFGGFNSLASVVCRMSSCLHRIGKGVEVVGSCVMLVHALACASFYYDRTSFQQDAPDGLHLRLGCVW